MNDLVIFYSACWCVFGSLLFRDLNAIHSLNFDINDEYFQIIQGIFEYFYQTQKNN
jgi:hypothetical protein